LGIRSFPDSPRRFPSFCPRSRPAGGEGYESGDYRGTQIRAGSSRMRWTRQPPDAPGESFDLRCRRSHSRNSQPDNDGHNYNRGFHLGILRRRGGRRVASAGTKVPRADSITNRPKTPCLRLPTWKRSLPNLESLMCDKRLSPATPRQRNPIQVESASRAPGPAPTSAQRSGGVNCNGRTTSDPRRFFETLTVLCGARKAECSVDCLLVPNTM